MVRVIEGPGTPEHQWAAWGAPGRFPPWDPPARGPGAPSRVVVIAPHPDDEILGIGGLCARLSGAGIPVTVIAVTDGGASHPGSPTLAPSQLIERRLGERRAALRELGLSAAKVIRLRLPDGRVAEHESRLRHALGQLMKTGDLCGATWREDGHPDHEAVGRAAAAACTDVGAALIEFPIWMWHWARPHDARVPWARFRRVQLPGDIAAAKREAVGAFRTQVRPLSPDPLDAAILPPEVLARLVRPCETVIVG